MNLSQTGGDNARSQLSFFPCLTKPQQVVRAGELFRADESVRDDDAPHHLIIKSGGLLTRKIHKVQLHLCSTRRQQGATIQPLIRFTLLVVVNIRDLKLLEALQKVMKTNSDGSFARMGQRRKFQIDARRTHLFSIHSESQVLLAFRADNVGKRLLAEA